MGVYVIVHGGGDSLREALCSLTMRVEMSPSKVEGLCSFLQGCPSWKEYLRILRIEEKIIDEEVIERHSYPFNLDELREGKEDIVEEEFKEGVELGRTLLGEISSSLRGKDES